MVSPTFNKGFGERAQINNIGFPKRDDKEMCKAIVSMTIDAIRRDIAEHLADKYTTQSKPTKTLTNTDVSTRYSRLLEEICDLSNTRTNVEDYNVCDRHQTRPCFEDKILEKAKDDLIANHRLTGEDRLDSSYFSRKTFSDLVISDPELKDKTNKNAAEKDTLPIKISSDDKENILHLSKDPLMPRNEAKEVLVMDSINIMTKDDEIATLQSDMNKVMGMTAIAHTTQLVTNFMNKPLFTKSKNAERKPTAASTAAEKIFHELVTLWGKINVEFKGLITSGDGRFMHGFKVAIKDSGCRNLLDAALVGTGFTPRVNDEVWLLFNPVLWSMRQRRKGRLGSQGSRREE